MDRGGSCGPADDSDAGVAVGTAAEDGENKPLEAPDDKRCSEGVTRDECRVEASDEGVAADPAGERAGEAAAAASAALVRRAD